MYYLSLFLLLPIIGAYQVFEYRTPVVTVKKGDGWIINGYLNIVHVIDLQRLEGLLHTTEEIFLSLKNNEVNQKAFEFYLRRCYDQIKSIKGVTRSKRSIDWIGSAWKWIAGNPDAVDWNNVIQSQEKLIQNNEHQYVVNNKLFEKTNEVVEKMNTLITSVNNKVSRSEAEEFTQETLNQLLIVKEDIEEIIRACQLAKSGVINTNLLDMEEIQRIVSEVDSLPYSNEIEAVEYGKPSIFSNGTSLLYILSIPKVDPKRFDRITAKAAIIKNRQLDLKYNTVLLNHENVYGIEGGCTVINNTTICNMQQLRRLGEDDCLNKILRGIDANCTFLSNKEVLIEQLEEDLVFVTNFKGFIYSQQKNRSMDGTFLVKYFNESIEIGGKRFTNERITNIQALPPLLTNIYEKERKLDINLLHELHEKNNEHIEHLNYHLNISFWSHITGYLLVTIIAGILVILWKKIFGKLKFPASRTTEVTVKE